MRSFTPLSLALAILILTPFHAFAAATPPGFDAAKWNQLLEAVAKTGQAMDGPDGPMRYFERINPPDTTKPRQAEYFVENGGLDSQGNFGFFSVAADSETWTIDAQGNWDIDQWEYVLAATGELAKVSRNHLVETMQGQVLTDDSVAVGGVDDPAVLAQWGAKLQGWFATGR